MDFTIIFMLYSMHHVTLPLFTIKAIYVWTLK